MDNLERYLDQVCRTIAGPRALRQHVREELREHLTDAIDRHRAAGLSEDEAIKRALDDFGGPEQVRAELEATHGHRVMGVVIDKAMQWKEHTMKGKWFWTTAAHLVLLLLVAGQVALLAAIAVFIVPKHEELLLHSVDVQEFRNVSEMADQSLEMLAALRFLEHYAMWIAIALLLAWAVFEWRVRSESKPFVRLTALALIALGLAGVVASTAGALVLPWILVGPRFVSKPTPALLSAQRENLDSAAKAVAWMLEEKEIAPSQLSVFAYQMSLAATAVHVLDSPPDLAEAVKSVQQALDAIHAHAADEIDRYDRQRLLDAMQTFMNAYGKLPRSPATTQAAPTR